LARILLLDDDIAEISAVKRVLARTGHAAVLATNASDAQVVLGQAAPDLVLVGATTEGGEGLAFTRRLVEEEETRALPVILLGAAEGLDGVEALPRPLDAAVLAERIQAALRAGPTARAGPAAPAPARPPAPPDARRAAADALRARAEQLRRSPPPAPAGAPPTPEAGGAPPKPASSEVEEAEQGIEAVIRAAEEAERAHAARRQREAEARARAEGEARAREVEEARAREAARLAAEAARAEADEAARRRDEETARAREAEARAEAESSARSRLEDELARLRYQLEAERRAREAEAETERARGRAEAEEAAASALRGAEAEAAHRHEEEEERLRGAIESARAEMDALRRRGEEEARRAADAEARALAEAEARARAEEERARERAERERAEEERTRAVAERARIEEEARRAEAAAREAERAARRDAEEAARRAAEAERRAREEGAVRARAIAEAEAEGRARAARARAVPADPEPPGALDLPLPTGGPPPDPDPAEDAARRRVAALRGRRDPGPDAPPAREGAAAPPAAEPDALPELAPPPRTFAPPPPELRGGSLAELPLPRLLALAARARVSGRLDFDGEAARALWLEDGRLVGAASALSDERVEEVALRLGLVTRDQHRQLAGATAALATRRAALLLLERGYVKPTELTPLVRRRTEVVLFGLAGDAGARFRWVAAEVPADERIALDRGLLALAVEGVRRRWLAPRLDEVLGGAGTLLAPVPGGPGAAELGLSPDERRALALADGLRTLDEILAASPLDALSTKQVLAALVLAGGLSVRLFQHGRPAAAAVAAIDLARIREKLEQARRADYFTVLGVGRVCTPHEVREAAARLLSEFDLARLDAAGLADRAAPELPAHLREIRQVVADAQAVLADETLREEYVRGLAG
jgi:CheY-like chemotaxis protein